MFKEVLIGDSLLRVHDSGVIMRRYRNEWITAHQAERKGYKYIVVSQNGHSKKESVHRLVCKAFHDNPLGLPFVNHIDGNPANNNADNLEWCTASQNTMHARLILNRDMGFIERPVICIDTKQRYRSTKEAERCTGARCSHITECAKGKRKTAGGLRWEYEALR